MKRNVTQPAGAAPAPQQSPMKKLLASALFGAAMLGVSMAQAATATTVLTFENVTTTALFNQFDEGDTFSQSGFVMTPYSPYADAGGTFVGQLIHGTDDPGLDVSRCDIRVTAQGAFQLGEHFSGRH